MMRLLLVEDDADLSAALLRGLREEGYAVDHAANGEDGLFEAESGEHDLIILDVMLPGFDGFHIIDRLRAGGHATPVIFLTARDSVEDRVRGLRAGGDDYLVKPFSFEELLARVRAVLRRSAGAAEDRMAWGKLEMETARHRVSWAGAPVPLTPREFAILEALLRHRGIVLSRTELVQHVYDGGFDLDSNVIDVHVANLRRKLAAVAGTGIIETVRGIGFRLPEPEP